MFNLQRMYAFTIIPQRLAQPGDEETPEGGVVKLTTDLRDVVQKAFTKIQRGSLTQVDFALAADRTHQVRDDIMQVAFGTTQTPRAAAARLAARLASTMDNRSHAALLVIAIEEESAKRRASLLLLPREDVIQLRGSSEDVLLNVLQNAFSTGSGLRKLARLTGHNSRTQFLSAEVLDFQLTSSQRVTADFWVTKFLSAKATIDSATGSKLLATALQRAFDASDPDTRDAVFALMFRGSSGTQQRTSLTKTAEELPENLQSAFFAGVPDNETRDTIFTIDRSVMKEGLARRIITGKDGVIVSAPAETVGKSVELQQRGKERIVRYTGRVEKERVARGRKQRAKAVKS